MGLWSLKNLNKSSLLKSILELAATTILTIIVFIISSIVIFPNVQGHIGEEELFNILIPNFIVCFLISRIILILIRKNKSKNYVVYTSIGTILSYFLIMWCPWAFLGVCLFENVFSALWGSVFIAIAGYIYGIRIANVLTTRKHKKE